MGLFSRFKKKATLEPAPEANVYENPNPQKSTGQSYRPKPKNLTQPAQDTSTYESPNAQKSTKQNSQPKFELSIEDARNNYFLKQSFFTDPEYKFYERLREYLPKERFIIFPQVAYTALFDKDRASNDPAKDIGILRTKFNDYKVDFVICDNNFKPLYAIELDDKSHRQEDIKRKDEMKNKFWDALMANAPGFKFSRIPCMQEGNLDFRSQNSTATGLMEVLSHFIDFPMCLDCGEVTQIKHTKHRGGAFFIACTKGTDHDIQQISNHTHP
ncbi:MAG: DUF2726 domain-containing protein [Oscillospiraceae bacterium]|nr:DUF2726 domain-containing protein [Oscillospiraceae bacterium]